ncbi:hypothetical protein SAMN04487895_10226 [Paenibacillus sophorae]|uniref:Glycosyltransferase family 39 protein n=1 Tax=Paenibacillus sophorae TaxID=1333845 RepID=A0A1H8I0U7_9BACL|nr:hypothetical protein [Paenibacillus sophorae]QWU15809.1 glycosyltransferase family 39 protein [Paenibacillus sophorae]SEN61746.1 hypothetical protein SAMN04487895_10226 [Paenibacillus sophorae]
MKLEENFNNTKYRYSLWIIIFLFCGYMGWIFIDYYANNNEKIAFPHYLVASLLFYGVVIILLKQIKYRELTYIMFALLGLYYILFLPFFSPIDEGAHFDYILHIIQQHKLPTLYDIINTNELYKVTGELVPSNTQYEAVQPPLYYLVSSLLAALFQKSLIFSVIMLRVFGIVLILLTYFFIQKTYLELVRTNIIEKNDHLFHAVSLLFFLNPGFMTRMITISNEQLVVFLMSVLIFYIVKILGEKHSFKHLTYLSLITAAMILTKFTSIYIIGVIILFYLLNKEIKEALYYAIFSGILISPWFIFNLYHYQKFTANSLHVAFVKGIVNPNNIQLSIYYILQKTNFFLGSFWNPQESGFPGIKEPYFTITNLLSWVLIGTLVGATIYAVKSWRNLKDIKSQLITLLTSSIFLNIIILCYGTISQDVDIMIGRYVYMNSIGFIILTVVLTQKVIVKKYHHLFGWILLMMICFLTVNFMFDTAQSRQNFATKIKVNILEEKISLENYQQKIYNPFLNTQDLKNIPSKLDGNLTVKLDNSNVFHPELYQFNNISLENLNELKIIGNDPFLVVSLNNAHSVQVADLIKVTLNNVQQDGIGQLFWDDGTGYSENRSIKFSILKGEHSYFIPVGRNASWMESKNINKIRMDVDGYAPNNTFILKEFMLTKVMS